MPVQKVFAAVFVAIAALVWPALASADTAAQATPFAQSWTNTGLITTENIWTGVPGIIGYRGDDLTMATGTNPQTIVADGASTPVSVLANQANPNTQTTGAVAEFDAIGDPTIALQGSGTADAPQIVIALNTTGRKDVTVSYTLRDIDGSADNTEQPVALQYRVGGSGDWTNLPSGFVEDATSGPSLASLTTPIQVVLPDTANDRLLVGVRVLTTNAIGNDEWVGVDDISITSTPIPQVVGGGQSPGASVTAGTGTQSPTTKKPSKCRKGFKKRIVHGKRKCVKKPKHAHKKGKHH